MYFIRTCLLLWITFCLASCKDPKESEQAPETHHNNLENALAQFNQAFRDGDTATLSSLISENYRHTNGNAKVIGRDEWLRYLRKREENIKSGRLKVIDYRMEEIDIQYYGDLALVTGKVMVTVQEQDRLQENSYRVTHLWVHQNGTWKRGGFHDTKIK